MVDLITNLAQLKSMSIASKYEKNSVIIQEGAEAPYSMYLILQGEVRVVKDYGQVDQKVIARLRPGDFFGETSLFLLKPRSATVITSKEETVVLEITEENVYEVIENNPKLLHGIIKTLCSRIDYLNEKLHTARH